MFKKIKCKKCGKKIREDYVFCPYCGDDLDNENFEDFGMLGKSDSFSETELKIPVVFNSLLNSVMNNLSKELNGETDKKFSNKDKFKSNKNKRFSINISTFGVGNPKIQFNEINNKDKKDSVEKIKNIHFDAERVKKFIEMKKEEPKTNLKRLSNKIVYEIEVPEVSSKEDISILQLENSIEIKAIGKTKSYSKIISVNLPIINYNLINEKLFLELGLKN